MFVRAKNYELNGNSVILVISPLKSIIEDQLQEMELLGYPAKDLANLSRFCNYTEQMVILAACFTLRGHDIHID